MQKSVLRPACLGDERKSRRTTPICVKKTTFRVQQYVRVQDVLHCQVCGSDGCLGSSPVAAEVPQVANQEGETVRIRAHGSGLLLRRKRREHISFTENTNA